MRSLVVRGRYGRIPRSTIRSAFTGLNGGVNFTEQVMIDEVDR